MQKPDDSRLKHRDLNWLSFNERVLQEAEDHKNPLYERIKFLAIYSSNLDEYFRVRVSQLRQIKRVEKSIRKKLALKPTRTTKKIIEIVKQQHERFGKIYNEQIVPELAENGILLINHRQFNQKQKNIAKHFFQEKIQPEIKAHTVDPESAEKLFLENSILYFIIEFEEEEEIGVVNLPVKTCGRFINLVGDGQSNSITYLDEIIIAEMQHIFPHKNIKGIYEVKLSRDAELYIEDKYNGILAEKIYESLAQRTDGQPTRLLYDSSMPKTIQKKLRQLLDLGKIDMMPGGKYHNFKDFFSFPEPTGNPKLKYKKPKPIKHRVLEYAEDYFKEIGEKDLALHFPYMSFKYVENFLKQAVEDKNVTAIKISLYRVADQSALTSLLLKALENGKKLTVFVEAKARFDEENNIIWGRKFEEKGANVIYSYPKVKVHSKIMLIQRKEENQTAYYAYVGTGNFNSETSKTYCDHAVFTTNKYITKELSRLFKVLEGELIIPREKNLLISPFSTRQRFNSLIYNEIENARAGKKAAITAKMNSLEDTEIIELLYKASQAGVKVRLLVRGFTCLIPGVKNLSENIYITSIVDRYLEHGRIYVFENGGEELMFFGSADWMSRNLNRRIEVLAPVMDTAIQKEFNEILSLQLNDNVKARVQDEQESNRYVQAKKGEKPIRSQDEIYKYLKENHEI